MKLEIEVPDGFIVGRLVFITEMKDGIGFDSIDVKTGAWIKKHDAAGANGKHYIPWEAD